MSYGKGLENEMLNGFMHCIIYLIILMNNLAVWPCQYGILSFILNMHTVAVNVRDGLLKILSTFTCCVTFKAHTIKNYSTWNSHNYVW